MAALKNKAGKLSWTKIAGAVIAACGVIVSLPATVGIPLAVVAGAKIVAAIAVAVGANGVRNAIDNK